ncbi:MAG: hypothetical protein RLZZ494_1796 [Pseudomonadota bacterium]
MKLNASNTAMWPMIWIMGIWWLSREFLGPADHDGIFYSGEALRHLLVLNFSRDIFFDSFTQGNYSIFGSLYAHAIQFMGIKHAAWLMSFGGRSVWAIGALALAYSLTQNQPASFRVATLALVMLLPSTYDGVGFFKFGEAIVTPRCWAEGLSLLAISQSIKNKNLTAWILGGTALLFHPLMALPTLVIVWGMTPPRIRNLTGGIGCLLISLAVFLSIDPFGRILTVLDPPWWDVISSRNIYITPLTWPPYRITGTIGLLILCWHVVRVENRPILRRLAQVTGYLIVIDLCLWTLGIYTRNALLVQLQLWRVLWVGQILIPALWVQTLRAPANWKTPDIIHTMMVIAMLVSQSWSIHLCLPLALWITTPQGREFFNNHPRIKYPSILVAAGIFALTLPAIYPDIVVHIFIFSQTTAAFPVLFALSQEPVITLPLIAGSLWLTQKLPKPTIPQALVAAIVTVCSGYAIYAQWKTMDEAPPDVRSIQAIVPPGAVVYWDQGLTHTWLVLNRASYASFQQGAGAIFSRQLTLEISRRLNLIAEMGIQESGGRRLDATMATNPAGLCADVELDFLLLQGQYPDATHQIPHPYAPYTDPTLSIFDCAQLRRTATPPRLD